MTTKTETGGIDAIERTLELRANPERVWRALTRPEELVEYLGENESGPASG